MKEDKKVLKISNKDIEKLEKCFKMLDNDAGSLGLALVEELKFSRQTIKKLKKEIKANGVVVDMPQGNYSIRRSNPALTSYNALIKNYQSLIKQVFEMLPSPTGGGGGSLDDFDNF